MGGNAYFQQLLILSRLTGYYFRIINTSYCIQYGCFVTSRSPWVRFGYNSLNSCWFCDEKHLLSCCAARDTHFSAFIIHVVYWKNCITFICHSFLSLDQI